MDLDDFLLDDYKLKVSFLTNQYNGMWTRFNYFVAIETALIGGKFIFGGGTPGPALALVGFSSSLIWYCLAAQDSYLARLYQKHIQQIAQVLLAPLSKNDTQSPTGGMSPLNALLKQMGRKGEDGYPYTGYSQDNKSIVYEDIKDKSWLVRLMYWVTRWRYEPISVSKLIALVPLLACLVWAGVLIGQFIH